MKIRSTMARAATVGGIAVLGYLGVTAGGASAQSPSPSPSTTAPSGATTSTTRVASATTQTPRGGTGGLANTGADPALLAAVGGGGAAIAIGARRLARRSA